MLKPVFNVIKPAAGVILTALILMCSVLIVPVSEARQSGAPWLNITLPVADTVFADAARHRLAGNTVPGSVVTVQNKPVKVYPNGAFAGMLDIPYGYSNHEVYAITPGRDTLQTYLFFYRASPPEALADFPVAIERSSLTPRNDMWMTPGEEIEVRFRGSPGYDATFDIAGLVYNSPMRELAPEEAGGMRGIYKGTYIIRENDRAEEQPVRVRLRRTFYSYDRSQAAGRISVVTLEEPHFVVTKGFRPFFSAGTGTDRLGGARLGYIDEGILLRVTGREGNMYRVQLAENTIAWLGDQFADPIESDGIPPATLTGSISVDEVNQKDVIAINLDRRLPYLSRQLNDPGIIEVDLFGVASNTNWITHHLAAEGIKSVDWKQINHDHVRLFIRLNGNRHWGYQIVYNGRSTLEIRVNRAPAVANRNNPLSGLRILVDAGHGGSNEGSMGSMGILEKVPALQISKKLEAALKRKGAQVIMTRTSDVFVGMTERQRIALASDPHMLLSIHLNSVGYSTDPERVKGASTYYRHVGFKPLADILYKKKLETGLGQFGVVGGFNFALNQFTEFPNVLVETGFMSNPEDEIRLLDERFQQRLVDKLVEGLEEYVRQGTGSAGS